jgi:Zn-dependent protease with chaperone function
MTTLAILASAICCYLLIALALSLAGYVGLRACQGAFRRLTPERRANLYAAAVLTPPTVIALLTLSAFGHVADLHDWSRALHHLWIHHVEHHRVCLVYLAGCSLLAVIILAVATRRAAAVLIATVRLNRRLAEHLQAPSEKLLQAARTVAGSDEAALPIGEAEGSQPVSVVFGIRRPCCLFTRPLVEMATGEELSGIVAHELEHVRRRDNLQRLALRLAAAIQWMFPWVARVVRQWQIEVELACDDRAVSLTGKPRSLATALMKVADPARSSAPPGWSDAALSGFCEMGPAAVRIRVERLLQRSAPAAGGSTPAYPGRWAVRLGIGGIALATFVVLSSRYLGPSIIWLADHVQRLCH